MTILDTTDTELASPESPGRWRPSLGAWFDLEAARFRVWAPERGRVELLVGPPGSEPRRIPMEKGEDGTHTAEVSGLGPGARYHYLVDGRGPFPDPASRSQPDGVHEASELVDPGSFVWTDEHWTGLDPDRAVIYELHVGTFSPEGTFDGVRERLDYLRNLGVTAIELMPVAEFAGRWSWGYDGVGLFAPSRNYGTPEDLRRLVDAAHGAGIAVVLDVVYNHFGPVGNYAPEFSSHYLSTTHSSPWAACVNLFGKGSAMVREFFIENALHWVHEYHLDGLRLDATHALIDESPRHLAAELTDRVKASADAVGRRVWVVAEDHRNDRTMLLPASQGGWGLDGVWADDLHHQLRRHVAGDNEGYYADYNGSSADIAATINSGWFYQGQFSNYLNEHRGTDPSGLPSSRFVVCLQNHDQVGNRAMGDRLHHQVEPSVYRAVSTLFMGLPQTPMLFMGQEWAAGSPFQYFTDHEPDLGKVVTEGRRSEFRHFRAFADPARRAEIPDPQVPSTFERSRLDWSELGREAHASCRRLYQALLLLRQSEPALRAGNENDLAVAVDDASLWLRRAGGDGSSLWFVARFRGTGTVDLGEAPGAEGGQWETVLTSENPAFAPMPLPPRVLFRERGPHIEFLGPAAVVLRRTPDPSRP